MVYHESTEFNFSDRVAENVLRDYGLDDAADLCFNLLELGRIPEDASLEQAAGIVAQHLLQP